VRLSWLTILAVAAAACGADGEEGAERLPDVTLTALSAGDAPLDLGDLDGPAVVNLWATWCAPCRRELPDFQRVSEEWPDVRFVGVDIGEDAAKAEAFLDELGVTFEQYVDEAAELTTALGAASLPVTLIVAGDGTVARNHLGPLSAGDLTDTLTDLTG
jgi:thiol-disulfide isomerase/thioredoxin